jgi:hypothetical protein
MESSSPPSPPARPSLWAPTRPGAVGLDNAVLTWAVHQQQMENRRENTSIAYDPKVLKFKRYCDYHQYLHESKTVRHLVAPDKVYNFMFYQAHHDKRKPGRPKRGAPSSDSLRTVKKMHEDFTKDLKQFWSTWREQALLQNWPRCSRTMFVPRLSNFPMTA